MLRSTRWKPSVAGPDGARRTVVLTAPTHPLRLLWLVTWAELGQHWLESAGGRVPATQWRPPGGPWPRLPRSASRSPFRCSGGRLTIAAADLTPYWGACLPTDTPDPQDLLAGLARALRLPDRAAGGHVRYRPGCSPTGSNVICASIRTSPRW